MNGRQSSASVNVRTNSPPYGGSLTLSPAAPYTALDSEIKLSAVQWTDDAEDLPLVYAYAASIRGGLVRAQTQLADRWC
eukprot:1918980-Prymnesium_polylepis.2